MMRTAIGVTFYALALLAARPASTQAGAQSITHLVLENRSTSVAFFVRLKVTHGKGGDEVLPVVWDDNYISLLPGERREVDAMTAR